MPPGQYLPPGPGFGAQPGYPAAAKRSGMSKGLVIGLSIATVALLVICGGCAVAGYLLYADAKDEISTGEDESTGEATSTTIDGLVNYRETDPDLLTQNHKPGKIAYRVIPPPGGDHNGKWQNCQGNVYDAEIPTEHAVHSLEHGAVWITYRPDLSSDQVDELADKIRGKDYTLMSPYPGLDSPITLQAWGYQLKVNDADDADIDKFITAYARTATMEPAATCGGGSIATGTEPAS